jgi:exonuclease 3'-5' domain-containing protein 1
LVATVLSVISLYIPPIKKIYLIDIHRLGRTAFSTTNNSATSLKTILESPTIPKVIFDIRNNSDALFSHFQISVDGIKDLQLMELATRKRSKDFVAGLAKCIKKDSPVSTAAKAEWQRTKEGASRLYDPKKGGRYEIFNERPMRPEIVQYCARDVALLPGLYNVYNATLRLPGETFWHVQVREATKDRIKLSQSPGYDGQAKTKVCGPWDKGDIEQAIDGWNGEVMFKALTGDNEDEDLDDYEDDGWNESDDISARDCIGWEEDMVKNGEYF